MRQRAAAAPARLGVRQAAATPGGPQQPSRRLAHAHASRAGNVLLNSLDTSAAPLSLTQHPGGHHLQGRGHWPERHGIRVARRHLQLRQHGVQPRLPPLDARVHWVCDHRRDWARH